MSYQVEPVGLSDEQLEFREMLRRFFDANAPMTEVRRAIDSEGSISPELWRRCCEELSLPGIAIAEEHGGQGFGLPELAIALGEAGRSLAPIPLLASAGLAARAVGAAGGDEAARWLRPIAEGEIATLAWVEASGSFELEAVALQAEVSGTGFRLSGEKRLVLDGRDAERFFVVARLPGTQGRDGLGLFAVARGAGVETRPVSTLDVTRKLATLVLDGAHASAVGTPGGSGAALARALEEATVLLCAEMVGGMEQVLETAVAYAGSRYQFGRAIGSFQAIKHRCADMLIGFEGARTATQAALQAQLCDDPERSLLASVAKSHASTTYTSMATENLQIHGGVGYTWEYDAHLYYRRARSCQALLGDAALHHERLARALAAEAS